MVADKSGGGIPQKASADIEFEGFYNSVSEILVAIVPINLRCAEVFDTICWDVLNRQLCISRGR